MSGRSRSLRSVACVVALTGVLAGCGGGGTASTASTPDVSGNSPPSDDTTPAQIQGVDTPSSVSVVTATNAN